MSTKSRGTGHKSDFKSLSASLFGLLIVINFVEATIDYEAFRKDNIVQGTTRGSARTTRDILEELLHRNVTSVDNLQHGTEHLLQYGALLRTQILDTFGKLVYDHYDDFGMSQIEALYRVYRETLERKYNIFDIVPRVLDDPDTRPTKICRYINEQIHTCLKESSRMCMNIMIHDEPHEDTLTKLTLNVTRNIYELTKFPTYYPRGFSPTAVLRYLRSGELRFTPALFSGLLHNAEYDSFDDKVRTAERELLFFLTRTTGGFSEETGRAATNAGTIGELLRNYLTIGENVFTGKMLRHADYLAQHVVREVDAISKNIELLGTVYDNSTINLEYLFKLILPNDTMDSDVLDARDYLLQLIRDKNIVEKYLRVEKYQQTGPDQLIMEIFGQLRDIHFAEDLVTSLYAHARFWHRSHMIENLNELLELFDAYENLRGIPEYQQLLYAADEIKSNLIGSRNVTVELLCSRPRSCLRIGLNIIRNCAIVNLKTKRAIDTFNVYSCRCFCENDSEILATDTTKFYANIEASTGTTSMSAGTDGSRGVSDIITNTTTGLLTNSATPLASTVDTNFIRNRDDDSEKSIEFSSQETSASNDATSWDPSSFTNGDRSVQEVTAKSVVKLCDGDCSFSKCNGTNCSVNVDRCDGGSCWSDECTGDDCQSGRNCADSECTLELRENECKGSQCKDNGTTKMRTTSINCEGSVCPKTHCQNFDCSEGSCENGNCSGNPNKDDDCEGFDCSNVCDGEDCQNDFKITSDCEGLDCSDAKVIPTSPLGKSPCHGSNCPDRDCLEDDCGNNVTRSNCIGPDCLNKSCNGDSCNGNSAVAGECAGPDCRDDFASANYCVGVDCQEKPDEMDDCKGSGCQDTSDVISDCEGLDCRDSSVVASDCEGLDCDGNATGMPAGSFRDAPCHEPNCPDMDCLKNDCGNDPTRSGCIGLDCVSKSCDGDSCSDDPAVAGKCAGPNCRGVFSTVNDCKGPDCHDKSAMMIDCKGSGCQDTSDVGSDCEGPDCRDVSVVTSDCEGFDCDGNSTVIPVGSFEETLCDGPNCADMDCFENDCENNVSRPECIGPDCFNKSCEGDDCNNKSGVAVDCAGQDCQDDSIVMNDCEDLDCKNQSAIVSGCEDPDCDSDSKVMATGSLKKKFCRGPDCADASCVGTDCRMNATTTDCTSPDCSITKCDGDSCQDNASEADDCKGRACGDISVIVDNCEGQDCQDQSAIRSDCEGPDCANDARENSTESIETILCHGSHCPDASCVGIGCGNNVTLSNCTTSDCSISNCEGNDCLDRSAVAADCEGLECQNRAAAVGDCRGPNCQNMSAVVDDCGGPGCQDSVPMASNCQGLDCNSDLKAIPTGAVEKILCDGPNCRDVICVGNDCGNNITKSDCTNSDCLDKSCAGDGCLEKSGLVEKCEGPDCEHTPVMVSDCESSNCRDNTPVGIDCEGPNCEHEPPMAIDCEGSGCQDTSDMVSECRDPSCQNQPPVASDCEGPECDGDSEVNLPGSLEKILCNGSNCPDASCGADNCETNVTRPDCLDVDCFNKSCEGDACQRASTVAGNCEDSDCDDTSDVAGDCEGLDCQEKSAITSYCEGPDCRDDLGVNPSGSGKSEQCHGPNCSHSRCIKNGCGDNATRLDCEGPRCQDDPQLFGVTLFEDMQCDGSNCLVNETMENCEGSECLTQDQVECEGDDCSDKSSKEDCKSSDCPGFVSLLNLDEIACQGSNCMNNTCHGIDCPNSGTSKNCAGPDCTEKSAAVECDGSYCLDDSTVQCTGPECGPLDCIGPNCVGNGTTIGCIGSNCPNVSSGFVCTGINCPLASLNEFCSGPDCLPQSANMNRCTGLDCLTENLTAHCDGLGCFSNGSEEALDCENGNCPDVSSTIKRSCGGANCKDTFNHNDSADNVKDDNCESADCEAKVKKTCEDADCSIDYSAELDEPNTDERCTGENCTARIVSPIEELKRYAVSPAASTVFPIEVAHQNHGYSPALVDPPAVLNSTVHRNHTMTFCGNRDPHYRRQLNRLQKMRHIDAESSTSRSSLEEWRTLFDFRTRGSGTIRGNITKNSNTNINMNLIAKYRKNNPLLQVLGDVNSGLHRTSIKNEEQIRLNNPRLRADGDSFMGVDSITESYTNFRSTNGTETTKRTEKTDKNISNELRTEKIGLFSNRNRLDNRRTDSKLAQNRLKRPFKGRVANESSETTIELVGTDEKIEKQTKTESRKIRKRLNGNIEKNVVNQKVQTTIEDGFNDKEDIEEEINSASNSVQKRLIHNESSVEEEIKNTIDQANRNAAETKQQIKIKWIDMRTKWDKNQRRSAGNSDIEIANEKVRRKIEDASMTESNEGKNTWEKFRPGNPRTISIDTESNEEDKGEEKVEKHVHQNLKKLEKKKKMQINISGRANAEATVDYDHADDVSIDNNAKTKSNKFQGRWKIIQREKDRLRKAKMGGFEEGEREDSDEDTGNTVSHQGVRQSTSERVQESRKSATEWLEGQRSTEKLRSRGTNSWEEGDSTRAKMLSTHEREDEKILKVSHNNELSKRVVKRRNGVNEIDDAERVPLIYQADTRGIEPWVVNRSYIIDAPTRTEKHPTHHRKPKKPQRLNDEGEHHKSSVSVTS